MKLNIAVLPGDGIGPEISVQGVEVMSAVCEKFGHEVHYEYALCGADAIDKVGDPFPEETYRICKDADAVLFSAVGDPKFDNDPTAKVRPEQGLLAMRKKLGLFANIRPVQTFKCLLHKSPLRAELVDGADFLCIRELTGGMYFGEKYQDNDKAYDTNMYTRPEIERILKVGFEYAMKRNKHLTVVDKANVLASSRLWRQIAQEMAPSYPEVTTDYMYVDNAAMQLILNPAQFDVMITGNLFGDILSDESAAIAGSLGMMPSASLGSTTRGLYEPLAFYATFFSVRAKAFDAEYCCAGMDAVKRKIKEIENNKDATAVEQNLLTTLEVCYEFYLRGFHFDTINIYKSDATKFIVTEKGLLPPFVTVHGLGEAAALDTVEKRKGKEFISIEEFAMCCNKLSKTHIEQLKALGAFAGMADTSQITLF